MNGTDGDRPIPNATGTKTLAPVTPEPPRGIDLVTAYRAIIRAHIRIHAVHERHQASEDHLS